MADEIPRDIRKLNVNSLEIFFIFSYISAWSDTLQKQVLLKGNWHLFGA